MNKFKSPKRKLPARPASCRSRSSHKRFVRRVIREVCGLSPYEKRMIELLRNGFNKRAFRVATKRLGSNQRAQYKLLDMQSTLVAMREAQRRGH